MSSVENAPLRAMKMPVREIVWLWHTLSNEGIDFDDCQLNSTVMRSQIAAHLTSKLIAALEHAKGTQLLPDDDFRWVLKDGRQPAWIVRKTLQFIGEMRLPQPLETLPIRQQVIAVFDLWNARLSDKKMALSDLEHAWREHLQHDKLFNWFKGKDEEAKCSLAWDWMKTHQPQLTRSAPPFTRHSELLEFFDRRDATPGEKELYTAKIKRRWSTQKTRENSPTKKQYNFVLSNEVNTTLDKLAQEHKLSRTKILEQLILNEAETGLQLGQALRKF
ncbi:hypothetical protein [Pseudomonas sp. AL03]|uniref:hypothetical protein n=1 Tax=Pseudomonas sp. AL03 TaxID=3042230 RepID=UPI00249CB4E6|nr:hypothetical protein [Pseudomonas sp. AL03]MDI3270826.1 hypothetical protein [Pseudomonas sp. AL03]